MFNFTLFLPNISIEMPNVYLEDIMVNVNVFDIVDIKGSYSYNSASDYDYYGYSELSFSIMFGEGEDSEGNIHTLPKNVLDDIAEEHGELIEDVLWEKLDELKRDNDYY